MKRNAGNALWFILIAIFLLAALTMLITKTSMQTEETGETERASIEASETLRRMSGVASAVQRLILEGCSESQLDFNDGNHPLWENDDAPPDGSCNIYGKTGGQTLTDTQADVTWTLGGHTVLDIGTSAPELLIVVDVSREACMALNRSLGISNNGTDGPPNDTLNKAAYFTGDFTAPSNNDEAIENTVFSGKKSGCLNAGGSVYSAYTVLLSR